MEPPHAIAGDSQYPSSNSEYPLRISTNIFKSGSNSFLDQGAAYAAHSCGDNSALCCCERIKQAPWGAEQQLVPREGNWPATEHDLRRSQGGVPEPCAVCGLPAQTQPLVPNSNITRFPGVEQLSSTSLASITVGYNGGSSSCNGVCRGSDLAMPYAKILSAAGDSTGTSQLAASSILSSGFAGADCRPQSEVPDFQPAGDGPFVCGQQAENGCTWPPTFAMPRGSTHDEDDAPTDLEEPCLGIDNSKFSIAQESSRLQKLDDSPTTPDSYESGDGEQLDVLPAAASLSKRSVDLQGGLGPRTSISSTETTEGLGKNDVQTEREAGHSEGEVFDAAAAYSNTKPPLKLSMQPCPVVQGSTRGARRRIFPYKIHTTKACASPKRKKKRELYARNKINERDFAAGADNAGTESGRAVLCDELGANLHWKGSSCHQELVDEAALGLVDYGEIVRDITDQLAVQLSHISAPSTRSTGSRDSPGSSYGGQALPGRAKGFCDASSGESDMRNADLSPTTVENSEDSLDKIGPERREAPYTFRNLETHGRRAPCIDSCACEWEQEERDKISRSKGRVSTLESDHKVTDPSSRKPTAANDLATDLNLMSGAAEALCALLSKYRNEVPVAAVAGSRQSALLDMTNSGLNERFMRLRGDKNNRNATIQEEVGQKRCASQCLCYHAQRCCSPALNSNAACKGSWGETFTLEASPYPKTTPEKEIKASPRFKASPGYSSLSSTVRQPWKTCPFRHPLSRNEMLHPRTSWNTYPLQRSPQPAQRSFSGGHSLRMSEFWGPSSRRKWLDSQTERTFGSQLLYQQQLRSRCRPTHTSAWLRSASDGDALYRGVQASGGRWQGIPRDEAPLHQVSRAPIRSDPFFTGESYPCYGTGRWGSCSRPYELNYVGSKNRRSEKSLTSKGHACASKTARYDPAYDVKPYHNTGFMTKGGAHALQQKRATSMPARPRTSVERKPQGLSRGLEHHRSWAASKTGSTPRGVSAAKCDVYVSAGEQPRRPSRNSIRTWEAFSKSSKDRRSEISQTPVNWTQCRSNWVQKTEKPEEDQDCIRHSAQRDSRSPSNAQPPQCVGRHEEKDTRDSQTTLSAAVLASKGEGAHTDGSTKQQPDRVYAGEGDQSTLPPLLAECDSKSATESAGVSSGNEHMIASVRMKPSISSLSEASSHSLSSTGVLLNVESFFSRGNSDDQGDGRSKLTPVLSSSALEPGNTGVCSDNSGATASPSTPLGSRSEPQPLPAKIITAAASTATANNIVGACGAPGSPTQYVPRTTQHFLQGPSQQFAMSPISKPSRARQVSSAGLPVGRQDAPQPRNDHEYALKTDAMHKEKAAIHPVSVSAAAPKPVLGCVDAAGYGEPAASAHDALKTSPSWSGSDDSSFSLGAGLCTSLSARPRRSSCPPIVPAGGEGGSAALAHPQPDEEGPARTGTRKPIDSHTFQKLPSGSVDDTDSCSRHKCSGNSSLSSVTSNNGSESALHMPPQHAHQRSPCRYTASGNAAAMLHALQKVLLSGPDQKGKLHKIVRAYEENWQHLNHFVIALSETSGGLAFRAIYALNGGEFTLICKLKSAPIVLEPAIVERYFVYNASALTFVPLQNTAALTGAFDAVTLAT